VWGITSKKENEMKLKKTLTLKETLVFGLATFIVGTIMGGFILKLAFILAVVGLLAYFGYLGYNMYKAGAFSK